MEKTNLFNSSPFFLVGPTASGKSDIALELAFREGAEILSLDSMQVYRGMDIGTAKLPLDQRRGIPHHLIDIVEPNQAFSVADYRREAEKAVSQIHGRKKCLFVGGTALYLKVLTYGLFEGAAMDAELRKQLNERAEKEGDQVLHKELATVDPVAASRIHVNDRKRVVRALEVYRLTGSPISELQKEWVRSKPDFLFKMIGLRWDREKLNQRIAERVKIMLDAGWVQEVQRILAGPGFGPQSSQALGYREIVDYLQGKSNLEQCEAEIVKKTRIFARRQMTWLRSFSEIRWIDLEGEEKTSELAGRAQALLEA